MASSKDFEKIWPTATLIVKKVVEFEIKTAGTILADIKNNGDDQMSENIN